MMIMQLKHARGSMYDVGPNDANVCVCMSPVCLRCAVVWCGVCVCVEMVVFLPSLQLPHPCLIL